MASNVDFEYEDEESIDGNLKCSICSDPFTDPVITLCHHSYCCSCLTKWLNNGKSTCPSCRQIISQTNVMPITLLNFTSMINQIRVKCKLCDQSSIQRGNFTDHSDRTCLKKIVNCTSHRSGCSWTGSREDLSGHLVNCTYHASESVLVDSNVPVAAVYRRSVLRHGRFNEHSAFTSVDPDLENVSGQEIAASVRDSLIQGQCTNLNLFGYQMSPENVLVITSAFSNNASLKRLDLGKCSLGDLGIRFLSPALAMNGSLECLDLYGNSITDVGVQHLASMLEVNRSLSELRLAHNTISNRGVSILAYVLKNHKSQLKSLSLAGNPLIDYSSLCSIFYIIRYNRSLKKLNLAYCNISWYSQQSIKFFQAAHFRTDLEILF